MKVQFSLFEPLRRRASAAGVWVVLLTLLLGLSGCVVPLPPTGQVDTLPPGEVTTEPVIAVAPVAVEAGEFVSVSGAGWPANQPVFVNVEWTQDGERVATTVSVTTTEEDGRFNASFFLPDEAASSGTPELTLVVYATEPDLRVTTTLMVIGVAEPVTPTETPTEPTATATPLPATVAPTATPVPPAVDTTVRVVSRGLNLRSGPGAAYAILRSLTQGTTLDVLGQSRDAYWLYVRIPDGTVGWVARPYTNFTGTAPVVEAPAAPPPPPTATRYPTPTPTPLPPPEGWRGEYFANRNLSDAPALVRTDPSIDFDWGFGAPARGLPGDNFSVRWTRSVYLEGGTYRFTVTSDDGVRVWLGSELIIDQWREQGATTFTADRTVSAGYHNLRVEYFDAYQLARIRFNWQRIGEPEGWRGEYFANRSLAGSPALVRTDGNIDFDWGRGSPDSRIPVDNFSVRWTRSVYFDAGTYRFRVLVDDGARLWVDDHLLIDEWSDGSVRERTGDIYLSSGHHSLRLEYYERTGDARIRLTWERITEEEPDDFPDWKGEYWNNRDLEGSPRFRRNDREINFNWGSGSPDSRISDDNFSVRWTRDRRFDRGLYRFYARADDGIRVWVDGDRIIDEWRENDYSETFTADIFLDGRVDLRVEYFERRGGARVRVWWERIADEPARNPFADVNPTSGPAGANVIVTGGGFPANTAVYLYLGAPVRAAGVAAEPMRYAAGVTDSRGEYRLSFVMPATWPDGTPIEPGDLLVLVATDNFTVEASDTFEFQAARPPVSPAPYVDVNPGSGGPETPVTVNGGGFPPNTRVNAHLARIVTAALRSGDSPAVYASTTTDGQGNFTFSFIIPRQWRETNDNIETGKLLVVVATDDFRVQASDTFDYFVTVPRPSINVAPLSGGAGTPVAVNGSGFPGNTPVGVYLGVFGDQIGRSSAYRYASTVTDRSGNYGMAFTMPATWPDGSPVAQDRLIIMVATDDFSVQVSEVFTYLLPAPVPPTSTPTPTNTPPTPPTATPQPSLSLAPAAGAAGTVVNAVGGGFPPGQTVAVYLATFDGEGESGGRNQQYGAGIVDANGNFVISFAMPRHWPNGEEIDSGRIVVLVATNDFNTQATSLFDYRRTTAAGSGEPLPAPTDVPEPTATPTPEPPTATPEPPTPTPEPTETPLPPTPTETATPEPPTPTPEPTETATSEPSPTPTETEIPPPAEPITGTTPITQTAYWR
ncbi:MAG: hypothetical protein DCC55_10075 [Chloroflexi bacterium]|nr:MAG: hypothetical protein DCC55_10075 [Chloroflexota bacterium]